MPGVGGFESIMPIVTDGGAKLSKYQSSKTGMTICIAETHGPLVSGYLTLATEAQDDDGLPHTLEHLIFLGSEKFPYKGVLDLLANHCLAQGTNAWTDTDHTCYTVTTAGSDGFLKLLPIYIDHLLYPILTDAAYVTEVHHIDGEGEDAGVAYNEMQTRENSGESRCYLAMVRAMYPGKCGYRFETGGLVKNMRESTSNKKVKEYHRAFYRPENLCVIICGQIDPKKVFEALQPVEERILQDEKREPFTRPWQTPVPELSESVSLKMEYPSEEDEHGIFIAAWRGPKAKDYFDLVAVQVLMDYFTDNSVSPVPNQLVEVEDAYCNSVDYTIIENAVTCIYLHFSNVPTKKLGEMKEKLFGIFESYADKKEEFDMSRVHTIIKKKKLFILTHMENCPHEHLASCLIADFLYGDTLDDLKHRVQEIPVIESLLEESAEFWVDLLKKYITGANHVIIEGVPSPNIAFDLAEAEKMRVEEQRKKLGPEGLKEKARILKESVEKNETPPPQEMLNTVGEISTKSIQYHPIKRICNLTDDENSGIDFAIKEMPCHFQLDVIKTHFVRACVLMDTSDLPQDLRLYLPLFVELFGECAIERNGEILPYQEVVKEIENNTTSISINIGINYARFFSGTFAQLLILDMLAEEEKYQKSIKLARELLYQVVFEPPRIKSAINKLITEVSSCKRQGGTVMRTMLTNLVYQSESNRWASSMLRQAAFLKTVLVKLDKEPETVIETLNKIKEFVTKPDTIIVHLSVNLDHLKKSVQPEKPWIEDFFPPNVKTEIKKSLLTRCHQLLQPECGDGINSFIVGLGSVETSYLLQCSPCVKSSQDPDYIPILVLIQYLTQLEGPVWRQVRGLGLAYDCSMFLDPDTGLIYFSLTKSTNLVRGYKEAYKVIMSHLNGESKFKKELLEAACSSLIFEIIERVKTIADVVEESVRCYFNNVDMSYIQELLDRINNLKIEDMEHAGAKYLKPLFQSDVSKCSVCCHPSKVKDICKGFEEFSRKFQVLSSLADPHICEF